MNLSQRQDKLTTSQRRPGIELMIHDEGSNGVFGNQSVWKTGLMTSAAVSPAAYVL